MVVFTMQVSYYCNIKYIEMKKLFYIVALAMLSTTSSLYAQDSIKMQSSKLLSSYYSIKDALVNDDAGVAASNSKEFVEIINGIDKDVIPEASSNALIKDADNLSQSKDIKRQREYFTSLSTNMFALAKAVKLTKEPLYQQYCPMKKAAWLSSNQTIKNPYFGRSMLTCGKVTATL